MEKVGAYTDRATEVGEWRPGNPGLGQQATPMLAAYFNMLQRELVGVVEASGQELDAGSYDQMLRGIRRLSGGFLGKNVAGGINVALTEAESQNAVLAFTGALAANIAVTVPALGRSWKVVNDTTGAFTLTLKTPGGGGVVVAQGTTVEAYCDGVSVFQVATAAGAAPGAIQSFATNSPPTGWLKANGAAVSRATYASLFAALVTAAGFTPQTFTVTLATPGVFTKVAHGLQNGARVRLATAGALPTGLNTATDYFVEVINGDTFYLSLTLMGARIATSGAQNGVHTFLQSWFGLGDGATTFNLPDLRGEFLRGWDDGRGIDAGRVFGSAQLDAFQGHRHGWLGESAITSTEAYATGGANITRAKQDALIGNPITDGTNGAPRTAAETRPRSLAMLVCIKF